MTRFYTLGRFELHRDGHVIPRRAWGTHHAASLCKVLLTHHGQHLHREQIQDWLWPDASSDAASRNLRVALSELRRILEPARQARETSRFIEKGSGTIALFGAGLWIDTQVVLGASQLDPLAPDAVSRLKAAAELYRGVYLPDDLYEDWAQVERERVALAHEAVLLKLAQAHAAQRDFQAASRVCERALLSNPMSESFVEHRLRYAWHTGDTAPALQAYDQFRQLLASELNITPSLMLVTLADQIRQGRYQPPLAEPVLAASPRRRVNYTTWSGPEGHGLQDALNRSRELALELTVALDRLRASRDAMNAHAAQARLISARLHHQATR